MTEEPCEECGATFTGPDAHIAIVNHVSAVHIHGTVASEPAEPTTRQDPRTRDAVLARVIEEANEQVDDDWTTADTLAFREYFGERLATRLADAGLLADPAQTAEVHRRQVAAANLERDALRAELDEVYLAINGYADATRQETSHEPRTQRRGRRQ